MRRECQTHFGDFHPAHFYEMEVEGATGLFAGPVCPYMTIRYQDWLCRPA